MSRREKYKPLWADPPPGQPDAGADVTVNWVVEEDDAPPAPVRGALGWRAAFGAALVLAVGVLLAAVTDRGAFAVAEVPSFWGDVKMRCETVTFERDGRTIEAFGCRAVDGGALPPGTYRTADSNWISDITGREAREHFITISPEGELEGVAVY